LSWNSSGQFTIPQAATFSSSVQATQFNAVNDRNYLARGSFRLTSSSNNASTLDMTVNDSTTYINGNYYSGGNDNTIIIGTYANYTNQLVLKNTGNVLLNYTSVWNQEKFGIQIQNSNNWTNVPSIMRLTNYGSGYITKMTFTDSSIIDGIFGMIPVSGSSYFVMGFSGATEQGFKLYQNGNLTIAGTITESSSIRYKENVETLKYGLDKIVQLRGVTYNKKDTGAKEIGLIAEEVESILPDVILRNQEGEPDSVSYGRITAVLVEAIKELKMEIEELKRR
jgi:hypothetical protein